MTKKEIKFRPITFVIYLFLPEDAKYDISKVINYDYLNKVIKEAFEKWN